MYSGPASVIVTLLSFTWLATLVGAQTPAPTGTEAAIAARLQDKRAELAKTAFDAGLLREAGTYAGAVLRGNPEHAIASLAASLKQMNADEFVRSYREAVQKHGKTFRKRAKAELGLIANELFELGTTTLATDSQRAERLFAGAYEVDPDHDKARAALQKLDYDAIFNYGVLPKGEKIEARKLLRSLGGGFLNRRDLDAELENWTDAWGLETRHYRFVTNAPHGTVFAFAQACEDLYDALDEFLKSSRQSLRNLTKPSTVYSFRAKVDYECVLRLQGMEPADSEAALGFYSPQTKIGYFYYDHEFYAGDTTMLFETFFHEGAHQQFDLRLKTAWRGLARGAQLHWVEEGLATYLESLVVTEAAGKRTHAWGTIVDDDLGIALDALAKGELLPLDQFVHIDGAGWDAYVHGYPHGALVMHWLFEADGGKRCAAAFDLLVAERQNAGLRKGTFFELIGMQLGEAEAAVKAHAERIGRDLQRRKYPN